MGAAGTTTLIPTGQPAVALRRPVTVVSPLRYPGAKRRLSSYISECLRINNEVPRLFVEPFAGGASVSLELLARGEVETIALGERDPLVAGFWKVVFNDVEGLIEEFRSLPVDVKTWKRYKRRKPRSDMDRAVTCLYLNRTSFSGILAPSAGPIGGIAQESDYDIACRMAPGRLEKRLRQIAALKDKVAFVHYGDWRSTLARARRRGRPACDVFYYLDPPFYHKASRLYTHSFSEEDHIALRNSAVRLRSPWILSYDPAEFIADLYRDNGHRHVEFLYSASGGKGRGRVNELIIANLPHVPEHGRVWRTHEEWQADRSKNGHRPGTNGAKQRSRTSSRVALAA